MMKFRGQSTNFRRSDWLPNPGTRVTTSELFESEPIGGSVMKVYTSGQWVTKTVRVYLDGQWVTHPLRAYVNGGFT